MSVVVVVKHNGPVPRRGLSAPVYGRLLKAGIRLLAGTEDVRDAWNRLLRQGVIGMKVNCLAKKFNSTPVGLTEALIDQLIGAGREANDLVVWERTSRELAAAGYTLNASSMGPRCLGTDANGIGYGSEFYSSGDVHSLVSGVLTYLVDCNINLPILKDHSLAGMSGGLKNMYGAIHNPNKYHDGNCSPYCAHVSALKPIKERNQLTIVDAVRVQCNGGPGFVAQYMTEYGGILMSADPVAVDSIALEILEHLRREFDMPTLQEAGRPVKYLQHAEELELGTARREDITVQVLSVDESGVTEKGELF